MKPVTFGCASVVRDSRWISKSVLSLLIFSRVVFVYELDQVYNTNKSLYLSIKAPVCQWVCLFFCLFICSLTPPKRRTPARWNFFRDDSPWDAECFRLKNIRIHWTVGWKIACILATLAVNFILSSMNIQRLFMLRLKNHKIFVLV